jgi:hypothetical protein
VTRATRPSKLYVGFIGIAVGQLLDALDGLGAAFADDVGGAELARERDPVRVPAEDEDLLGAEPLRGDDAAEPEGAVADHGDTLARRDLGDDGGVMTVPIMSESVSSDGISASSSPTGSG